MKKEFRTVLENCLKDAGRLIADAAVKEKPFDYKSRANLVTETDKKTERLILGKISDAFPDHQILAEESGAKASASPYRWIVDPLDGTTNFAHGFPLYCVSIALEENGVITLGGVYDPTRSDLFLAERGHGAFLNGERIRISAAPDLKSSLLATGLPYDRFEEERATYYLMLYKEFVLRCHDVRRGGSAALDLAYVACGRFDGFWELYLQPWDVAAGLLLVEEAGGQVTDFLGKPYRLAESTRETLATNGKIQAEMVDILKDVAEDGKEMKAPGGTKKKTKTKTRGVWKINPKTHVKDSEKVYARAKEKASDRKGIDEIIDFFGE